MKKNKCSFCNIKNNIIDLAKEYKTTFEEINKKHSTINCCECINYLSETYYR